MDVAAPRTTARGLVRGRRSCGIFEALPRYVALFYGQTAGLDRTGLLERDRRAWVRPDRCRAKAARFSHRIYGMAPNRRTELVAFRAQAPYRSGWRDVWRDAGDIGIRPAG